jgi:hypothetical protein
LTRRPPGAPYSYMLLASGRYTENIEPVRESDSTIDGTSMRFNDSLD